MAYGVILTKDQEKARNKNRFNFTFQFFQEERTSDKNGRTNINERIQSIRYVRLWERKGCYSEPIDPCK